MLADLLALSIAMVAAAVVNYNTLSPSTLSRHLAEHVPSLLIAAFLYVIAFHFHRLYRYAWRFASLETVWAVIGATTVGAVTLAIIEFLLNRARMIEPRMLFVFWLLSIVLVGGVRILLRLLHARRYGALDDLGHDAVGESGPHGYGNRASVLQHPDLLIGLTVLCHHAFRGRLVPGRTRHDLADHAALPALGV